MVRRAAAVGRRGPVEDGAGNAAHRRDRHLLRSPRRGGCNRRSHASNQRALRHDAHGPAAAAARMIFALLLVGTPLVSALGCAAVPRRGPALSAIACAATLALGVAVAARSFTLPAERALGGLVYLDALSG